MTVQMRSEAGRCKRSRSRWSAQNVRYHHADYDEALAEEANAESEPAPEAQPFVRQGQKVGRNDPCPCGSGKKYKQCHGRLA